MDIIRNYVVKIIIYIVLTSYISVIFPDNSYKKYIRLATGALLVMIVIKPLELLFS